MDSAGSSSFTVTVPTGGLCAVDDDVDVIHVDRMVGLLGKCEFEHEVEEIDRDYTQCHDADCEITGYAPYDFWVSKFHSNTKFEGERSAPGSGIEFDLSARLENGAEIESAAIVSFAVSVDVTAEKKSNEFLFTSGSAPPDVGTSHSWKGQCAFSVSVKLIECEVSGGTVTVPSVDVDDLPKASGGPVVELAFPSAPGSGPQGTQRSPALMEREEKYTGKRRAIHAFGPLIVRFKPKTLVEE